MYNPIENHFAALINGTLYDAQGSIAINATSPWYNWDKYQQEEPLDATRVYRDTILQLTY